MRHELKQVIEGRMLIPSLKPHVKKVNDNEALINSGEVYAFSFTLGDIYIKGVHGSVKRVCDKVKDMFSDYSVEIKFKPKIEGVETFKVWVRRKK